MIIVYLTTNTGNIIKKDNEIFMKILIFIKIMSSMTQTSFTKNITKITKKQKNHHHYCRYYFICENCGLTKDVFLEQGAVHMLMDHTQKSVNSYAKITKVNLSFQGICHKCRNNKNN